MSRLAILTVRNEGAFLLEWLAHHRASGFTDFLVFSNNCQDGTDTMLDRLHEMGWLTHRRNDGPYDKRGIQFTALKDAPKLDIVKKADWILTLDVDEFVNIHVGDRTLDALFQALPDATAITLTWRLFGSSDQVRFEDTPVTETFVKAAPLDMPWSWRSAMFKTLFRNDGTYKKIGVHRPRDVDAERLKTARWFDGEGRELNDTFKKQRFFSDYGQSNHALVQLNHYALGSMESYVLKADRGRVNHVDHFMDVDYWVERNFNTETDTSIQALAPRSRPILHDLKSDPVLGSLHEAAVAWRRARFEELMLDEPFRSLFARLLMTPPSRPVSTSAAKYLMKKANLGLSRKDKT